MGSNVRWELSGGESGGEDAGRERDSPPGTKGQGGESEDGAAPGEGGACSWEIASEAVSSCKSSPRQEPAGDSNAAGSKWGGGWEPRAAAGGNGG